MGQKVYIVTAGTYSDYHIERVFLDRAKAETYTQLVRETDSWYADSVWVNDYDISDYVIMSKGYYVDFSYYIPGLEEMYNNNGIGGTYEMDVESYIKGEGDVHLKNETAYMNGQIYLTRPINGDFDREHLAAKYLKVCEDIAAQIKYAFANGASEYGVQCMFNDGAIKSIDDEEV